MKVHEAAEFALDARKVGADLREEAYLRHDLDLAKQARKITSAADALLAELAKPQRPTPVTTFSSSVVKAVDEKRFALFVAYSPNKLPARGADGKLDVASPEVLEEACWKFALNGLKVGVDHKPGGEDAARVVENFVWRGAPWHVVAPDGTEEVVSEGDWCVGLVFSPDAWEDFKAGRWGGVSLQGTAKRKAPTPETLKRQRK